MIIIKILFIDLLCPEGHIDINNYLLKTLKKIEKIEKIDLVAKPDYLEKSQFFLPEQFFNYKNKFDFRVKNFLKIRWIFKNINLNKYDFIFISSYETISFSIAWRKTINARVLVFNHNNIDDLKNNKIKKFFFKIIKDQVEHIVYEDFIKKYVKSLNIANKVWVNHHPIDFKKSENIDTNIDESDNKLLIYAPSSSNDDNFIRKLINYQERLNILNDNVKFIIKSNDIDFEDNQLKVISKRVNYDKYISNFKKADFISLLFNEGFEYRVSGVFFDSLVFEKKILFKRNKFANYYINKYPNLGYEFKGVKDFVSIINNLSIEKENNMTVNEKVFKKIYIDYSLKTIKKELCKILFN